MPATDSETETAVPPAPPTRPGTTTDIVRLSVNLAPDVADTLKDNARRKGLSITEAIRRAIAVWAFIEDARRRGQRVALIEDLGGGKERLREIVLVD